MSSTTQLPNNLTTVLAIESSCDETACAIVRKNEDGFIEVLSEVTATSLNKHIETKGVVPEVAAREQLKSIIPVIRETVKKTKPKTSDFRSQISDLGIQAIAVTNKPGLIGSLLVGVEAARTIAYTLDLPVIPVNHIEAHPYANFISKITNYKLQIPNENIQRTTYNLPPTFPLLSWVISGGHTDLYLMKSHSEIIHLGGTVDDAAGECFDKCARVLGFDYPGGPFIDKLAQGWQESSEIGNLPRLPRPLLHSNDYKLSFSGLKTAFVRLHTELKNDQQFNNETMKQFLAHELQEAIGDVIKKKTEHALAEFPEIQSVIISGGAAANSGIRTKLQSLITYNPQLTTFFPSLKWCTDNAVMIGVYALFHPELQTGWNKVTAMPF